MLLHRLFLVAWVRGLVAGRGRGKVCSLAGNWTHAKPEVYVVTATPAGSPAAGVSAVALHCSACPWTTGILMLDSGTRRVTAVYNNRTGPWGNRTGAVGAGCNTITWSDTTTWSRLLPPAPPTPLPPGAVLPSSIRKVHVVQSCHLDVGFVDLAVNIVNRYFDNFFPEAIVRARELQAKHTGPKSPGLVFMTHSWLVSLYLDCPSHFPAPPVDDTPPSFPVHNCSALPPHCHALTGCAMAPECRCDCGYPGITPSQCIARGCCDNSTKGSHAIPACFYKSGGAHTGPPPPAPPVPPPSQIPLHCPNASAQADMRRALKDGHIVFHVRHHSRHPCTPHPYCRYHCC
jgi:hypothetical protein